MRQRLGIQHDINYISQHIKKSPAGTIAGAYRWVALDTKIKECLEK